MSSRPLAVSIVAYRRPDLLADCLASVSTHLPDARVVVWDNTEHDRSADADAQLRSRHAGVTWLGDGTNIGFAAAVNAIADHEVTRGHDLLLLNPDAVLLSDLAGVRDMLSRGGVAAAAPLTQEGAGGDTYSRSDTQLWDVAHRKGTLLRALVARTGYAPALRGTPLSDLYPQRPDDVDGYLTGACLAISRVAWDEVGSFDDEFFLYGEESDWQRRALEAGYRLELVDEVGVRHTGHGTVAGDKVAGSRSDDLLRANIALGLERAKSARVADLYLAGTSVLDRVQRSSRRSRARITQRRDKPAVIFTVNRLVYGGAERQHVVLATELDRRGYDVTIVCMQRFGPLIREVPHSVRVVRQPWWAPMTDNPDRETVLISGDTNTETGFATLWKLLGRRRTWLMAPHIPPVVTGPTYSSPLARAMSRCDGVIALSDAHRREIGLHHDLGDRWFVAPNGVEREADLTPRDIDRPVQSPPHLVMLSRIVEHKNPHLLVEALGELRDLPWRLSIYGDGPDRERLEALTPPDLTDRIAWRGWCSGPDVAMADADVVCVPSGSEAFPMVILEAMSRAVPVVASGVCSVPEMLDHGKAGVVVSEVSAAGWREELQSLLSNPSGLPELGRRGFDRLRENYTVDAMADAYEAAFGSVRAGSR